MKYLIFSWLLALNLGIYCEKFSFKGYQLWRLYPRNADQFDYIHELELTDNQIDIWGVSLENGAKVIDVVFPPSIFNKYKKTFSLKDIPVKVLSLNIQDLLDLEERSMKTDRNDILFKYARYNEINNYINTVVDENSDIASKYLAGLTKENRQLQVIVIKSPTSSRAIWIDCGIHAREWVTPSTCVYIIHQLIHDYRNLDPETVALLEKYEFHIMPLVNPDGYEHTHTTYRLWRKNRNPNQSSSCIGTDLNRNFPFQWMSGGASHDPCSDTYGGPTPGSELETKAVVESINKKPNLWDAFFSLHSKGQWWLTPFGYTTAVVPPDNDHILAAANLGAAAIKNYNGSIFTVGPSSVLLYINSGSSSDWSYVDANIRYSYVLELRPGAGTPDEIYSWALPEDRMPLVATETYIGIKESLKYVLNNSS